MVSHREAIELVLKFNEATDAALELESNERKLRANDYIQDRGLIKRGAIDNLSHVDFFGDCYLQALKQLRTPTLVQGRIFVWLGTLDAARISAVSGNRA